MKTQRIQSVEYAQFPLAGPEAIQQLNQLAAIHGWRVVCSLGMASIQSAASVVTSMGQPAGAQMVPMLLLVRQVEVDVTMKAPPGEEATTH